MIAQASCAGGTLALSQLTAAAAVERGGSRSHSRSSSRGQRALVRAQALQRNRYSVTCSGWLMMCFSQGRCWLVAGAC